MRLTLVATFALAITSQAHASVEEQLATCANHTDKLDRLMCYDALAASVSTATSTLSTSQTAKAVTAPAAVAVTSTQTNTAPVTPTAPVEASANTAEQEFGLKNVAEKDEQEFGLKQVADDEEDVRLYAEVSSIKKDPYGSLIVTLANEQTWKQVGTERYKLKSGQTIFIKKGALGSFLLGSDGRNSTMRVKRLK
ncbi:hypothetical protein AN944_01089 [Shewanella sp. P1-14-1]|uniref:hypothetical protein n=1 Tax=Shewanella sp. P1-14-1 TaxID=1723761 RepID=UPI0006D68AF7|nr:hypothetical protein [Shewanella sp. P1-14-1]KPZ72311.1 hypothetical protein AN944_01089 [Shewanella sp. P1-14-1]